MYEITSEIYAETNFNTKQSTNGKLLSIFEFVHPEEKQTCKKDDDGDFDVKRKKLGKIEIEHAKSTVLKLVGLQVWRGALLLADFIFENRDKFKDSTILELGAGVGLTSIVAAMHCKQVYSTDINLENILDIIKSNINRNAKLYPGKNVEVLEYDFKSTIHSEPLIKAIESSDIVIAADVIYDDDLTDCFIKVVGQILSNPVRKKTIYIALEKRYVFTIADLETVAPCFEYFLKNISGMPWNVKYLATDFPQYFQYVRSKDLVLLQIETI